MAKIQVHALDVDAVLAARYDCPTSQKSEVVEKGRLKSPYKETFLRNIDTLLQHIVTTAQKEKPTLVILISFSARQSVYADFFSAIYNETFVSTVLFRTLCEELRERLETAGITVELNTQLLGDLDNANVKHFEEIETKLEESNTIYTRENIRDFRSSYKDESKIALLYFILHLFAVMYDQISLYAYDDRFDILNFLHKFYKKNFDLLPRNISLIQFYQCLIPPHISNYLLTTTAQNWENQEKKERLSLEPLTGKGKIDKTYQESTLHMLQSVASAKRPNVAKVYYPNSPLLQAFKRERAHRLSFFKPFWKHPLQALVTAGGLGYSCATLLIMLNAPTWSVYLGAATLGLLSAPFNHVTAAIADVISTSQARIKAAMCTTGFLTLISIILLTELQAPIETLLLTLTVLNYFLAIPTVTAIANSFTFFKNFNLRSLIDKGKELCVETLYYETTLQAYEAKTALQYPPYSSSITSVPLSSKSTNANVRLSITTPDFKYDETKHPMAPESTPMFHC